MKRVYPKTPQTRQAAVENRVDSLERRVYEKAWTYVAVTYVGPDDPGNDPPEATADSPLFINLWEYIAPLAFRMNSENSLEWIGIPTFGEGGSYDQPAFVMGTNQIPDDDDLFHEIPLLGILGYIQPGWIEIDPDTGEAFIYPQEPAPLAVKLTADTGSGSAVTTDTFFSFGITTDMNEMRLITLAAAVNDVSSSGDIEYMLTNRTTANDMLNSPSTITAGQNFESGADIDDTNDQVHTGDIIDITVSSAGTDATGLSVYPRFQYHRPATVTCEICEAVLTEYRAYPERQVETLTADQELALLEEWHRNGHPDLNVRKAGAGKANGKPR